MPKQKRYPIGTPFMGKIGRTLADSEQAWPEPTRAREAAHKVIFFVLDDIGYGQLLPFGGLVNTPTLDKLAQRGLRYTNFHTTNPAVYEAPFRFTGEIKQVVVDVSGEVLKDDETELKRMMTQQQSTSGVEPQLCHNTPIGRCLTILG